MRGVGVGVHFTISRGVQPETAPRHTRSRPRVVGAGSQGQAALPRCHCRSRGMHQCREHKHVLYLQRKEKAAADDARKEKADSEFLLADLERQILGGGSDEDGDGGADTDEEPATKQTRKAKKGKRKVADSGDSAADASDGGDSAPSAASEREDSRAKRAKLDQEGKAKPSSSLEPSGQPKARAAKGQDKAPVLSAAAVARRPSPSQPSAPFRMVQRPVRVGVIRSSSC